MPPRWAALASAYIGAVVGAGFASGQEIAQFFARHGPIGLGGAALAGALFALMGTAALQRVIARNHPHYGALVRDVCGPWIGSALDHLAAVGLFVGLAAVVAGAGSLGAATWGWPAWWGSVVLATVLAVSALGGQRAFLRLNAVAAPLIVLACIAAACIAPRAPDPTALASSLKAGWTWVGSAALYVAYNLLLAIAGLCSACDGNEDQKDAFIGGIGGGLVLGFLCVTVTLALLHSETGRLTDLPLGDILGRATWGRVAYPMVLALSLWTTGSAATTALGRRAHPMLWTWFAAVIALAALPPALFGLRAIVTHLYPLIGYCGLPLLPALLWALRRPKRSLGKPGAAR